MCPKSVHFLSGFSGFAVIQYDREKSGLSVLFILPSSLDRGIYAPVFLFPLEVKDAAAGP